MHRVLNRFRLIFCLAACSCVISAQNDAPLSYNSFIENVREAHPLAKKAGNIKQYGEFQLKAARGNYDPLLSGSQHSKFFRGSNYYSVLNGEIKQPLFTSQYLKAGYDVASGNRLNPELYTPVGGIPFLGLEMDVLQGFVIDKRRADVLKARAYVSYYDAESNIQVNELLLLSANAYMEWLSILQQEKLNRYFLEIANLRFNGLRELTLAGERAGIDTVEASIQVQNRIIDHQATLLNVEKSRFDLNFFLRPDPSSELRTPSFTSSDSLEVYFVKCRNEYLPLISAEWQNNPELKKYRSLQSALDVEARLKKEMIKPRLNVSYNFLADRNAIQPETVFSPNSYKWGLNVAFPLLLRHPRNEYRMARIDLHNSGLDVQVKENEIKAKTGALVQNLQQLLVQLNAAEKNVDLSRRMLEAEKMKFEVGESSLFLINNRENKWLESELKLLELKTKFIQFIQTIRFLNGNLDFRL